MMQNKVNLFNLDRQGLRDFVHLLGEKSFRGDQLMKWLHQAQITDFSQMNNMSQAFRQILQEKACLDLPEIAFESVANDGTRKWLMRLYCGNCVETVFIPEKDRGTLCASSQIGCALDCSFCATGKQGFNRNLEVSEIIGQVFLAKKRLLELYPEQRPPITNVVMMGMGEPLLNFDAVLTAMNIMLDDLAYNISKYRLTLSTSGVIPQMLALKAKSEVALAVSLHAPNNALRNQLVPLNKKYPLEELIPVCRDYFAGSKRAVVFEYVMLDQVNDRIAHAEQLIHLLKGVACKINLIPFNPFEHAPYQRSSNTAIDKFQKHLQAAGLNVIVRRTRGDDIAAACGQLEGALDDKTTRRVRWLKKTSERQHDIRDAA